MKRINVAMWMAAALLTAQGQNITSRSAVSTGVSKTLSELAGVEGPASSAGLYDMPKVDRATLKALGGAATQLTPALVLGNTPTAYQTSLASLPVTVTKNFVGLGRGYNANWTDQFLLPPDTTMAVGPTQILQWVNVRLSVMDKNGTPLVGGALGYIDGNAIWGGLPPTSICRTANSGDPLVAYDRAANRWVLSQFAFGFNGIGAPVAPYAQCFAVSTSGDATGSYNLYEYQFDALPDYGKIGVWPDAYYMSYNDFTINPTTGASAFVGAKVCAYDRAAMIAGTATATQICTARYTNRFAFLPADLDGSTNPPAGAPNYVVSQDWFFLNAPPYSIRLQKFHVDFATPANSTFGDGLGGAANSFVQIPVGTILGSCGDGGGACIAQPGTARLLDTLSMRPMYRLAYRNRSGVESLVFTHSIDPPSAATGSIHWIELRNPGANPPQVYQNGAISTADGLNRWMGSAAMDNAGNLAVGYSVSSATVNPGIRIAGRYRTDVKNTLRGEMNVQTGGGAQTSSALRWGDYSMMRVDPVDDCTFWYTTEYMSGTFTRDWATKIIAFKFPNCVAP